MLTKPHKNIMGTVSFTGLFKGMRKAQEFIVYPMDEATGCARAKIQADTRSGFIDLQTGAVLLATGERSFTLAKPCDTLTSEELLLLKAQITATASREAGSRGVYSDNSAAVGALSLGGADRG